MTQNADYAVTLTGDVDTDVEALEIRAHLQNHLTDGRWHDSCRYCISRRYHGGTGVPYLPPIGSSGADS